MVSRWGTALLSRLLIEPMGIKELWIAAGGGPGWVAVTPEAVDGGSGNLYLQDKVFKGPVCEEQQHLMARKLTADNVDLNHCFSAGCDVRVKSPNPELIHYLVYCRYAVVQCGRLFTRIKNKCFL